jgi:NitT/TauT family transport system ATP-binding protein
MEGVSRAVAPPGTEEPPGASVTPGRAAGDAGREGALVPAVTRLNNVSFGYGDGLEVFRDLDLSFANGEIVSVVGPSGCGKSTLLSLIADLVKPVRGTITRPGPTGDDRHPLAMVFQTDTLLRWLTVRENVALYSRFSVHGAPGASMLRRGLRRVPGVHLKPTDVDRRVTELLDLVGMADSADSYPYQLSGGMRRRVAFIAAVAAQPRVLLLDEPFSAVDEPTRIAIHQDIYRVIRMLKMTTILVTHDLAEAITLSDRILVFGPRPAGLVGEERVTLGSERDMLELRSSDNYLRIYSTLWSRLSKEIRRGGAAAAGIHRP